MKNCVLPFRPRDIFFSPQTAADVPAIAAADVPADDDSGRSALDSWEGARVAHVHRQAGAAVICRYEQAVALT